MLRTVASRTFDEITRIRLDTPSADPSLDARNPEFVQLSPLRKLEIRYQAICGQSLSKLEKRCAYVQPPWWTPIAINKEEGEGKEERATKTHDLIMGDPDNITIFTDGSGIRNTVGASAIWTLGIMNEGQTRVPVYSKAAIIGEMHEYTVYFGELYGILMALELVKDDDYLNSTGPVHIIFDNQASL